MISNYPSPEQEYTVLVRCFTFNHSKYIEDALNGFVMQQTTFPFACLVVDDASTDGEQEVIKSWMEQECDMADAKHIDIPTAEVIIVPHKTNRNCTIAVYLLRENLFRQREKKMKHVIPWREHCQYEAMCEGDDYWIDPLKLQTQVDFLDAHPEVSYSCHRFNVLDEYTNTYATCNNKYFDNRLNKNKSAFIFSIEYPFQVEWITLTLTQVIRTKCFNEHFLSQFKYSRDVHLVYNVLSSGKGVCHNFIGGVSRISNVSTFGKYPIQQRLKISRKVYEEFYDITKYDLMKICLTNVCTDLIKKHIWIIPHHLFEFKSYIIAIWHSFKSIYR